MSGTSPVVENARIIDGADMDELAEWLFDSFSGRHSSSQLQIFQEPSLQEQLTSAFEKSKLAGRRTLRGATERAASKWRQGDEPQTLVGLAHLGASIGATGVIKAVTVRILSQRTELNEKIISGLVDALTGFLPHADAEAALSRLLRSRRFYPYFGVAANALCHTDPGNFANIISPLLEALDATSAISRPDLVMRGLLRRVPPKVFEEELTARKPLERIPLARRLAEARAGRIMVDDGKMFFRILWKGFQSVRLELESPKSKPTLDDRLMLYETAIASRSSAKLFDLAIGGWDG